MKRYAIGAAVLLLAVAGAYVALSPATADSSDQGAVMPGAPLLTVQVPVTFSEAEKMGQRGYDENCATCHGPDAAGRNGMAPPLVHVIYEPSHHGDEAFQRAAAVGVRSHHWRFGDMPPVPGLTRADVAAIISYIRALQRENGIE